MNDDFCPNCGGWDKKIIEEYGWCIKCVTTNIPNVRFCIDCDSIIEAGTIGRRCIYHKKEHWLETYANEIEAYLLKGASVTTAKRLVANDIRPTCICCGHPIKGANPNGRYFCSKTDKCKSAKRRFRTLKQTYNLPPIIALEQVQRELAIIS